MLVQIFKSILLMSAVGSILSIFLLCLMPVTRKIFGPKWQYYIWLTVLTVMLVPIKISLPARNIPVISTNQAEPAEIPTLNNQADFYQSPRQTETIPKIKFSHNMFYYAANAWLLGAIALLLVKIIKYYMFLRVIHKNSEVDTNITNIPKRLTLRKTDMLDAPLLVGLFKPVLLLPNTEISEKELSYILMHELTHYKRGDLLYKWLVMFVMSLHWFNPFVYIVSKLVDTECEISCDCEVTSKLSDAEKNNYMNMILDLLSNSRNNSRPLTTQMASGKKTIRRRFTMIRTNRNSTSKFVSVISVLLAVIILSTTVFASGILTDLTTDSYTIEILSEGKKTELENKPFIENGEVYVPLREMLTKLGFNEINSRIEWDNGTVTVCLVQENGNAGIYRLEIGQDMIWCGHITPDELNVIDDDEKNLMGYMQLKNRAVHILKNSNTYVSIQKINYMLYGFLSVLDENNKLRELTYTIYDKNGNATANSEDNKKMLEAATVWAEALITRDGLPRYEIMTEDMQKQFIEEQKQIAGDDWNYVIGYSSPKTVSYNIELSGNSAYITYLQTDNTGEGYSVKEKINFEKVDGKFLVSSSKDINTSATISDENGEVVYKSDYRNEPQALVSAFFKAFETGNFALMKNYCTQSCINDFFNGDNVFGMERASLTDMEVVPTKYEKSSNDFSVFVSVNMTPGKTSVFDPSSTQTSFYLILKRTENGRYLIDEFATGMNCDLNFFKGIV